MGRRAYNLPGAFALVERGMYAAQIAKELGVATQTIHGWARRNGVKLTDGRAVCAEMRMPSAMAIQRAEKMTSMYRQGLTLAKIGQSFGVTRERVRQVLKACGVVYTDGGQHKVTKSRQQARDSRRTAISLAKWGTTPEQMKMLREVGATRSFASQRNTAKQRGIKWSLSLAQWWDLWQTSGKWEQRGRGKGKYLMSRIKDVGGYEVGNVHIQLVEQNSLEAVEKWRGKTKASPGVFCLYPGTARPYIAKFRRHQIARCSTEEQAASARMAWLQANGYGLRDNGHAFLKAA